MSEDSPLLDDINLEIENSPITLGGLVKNISLSPFVIRGIAITEGEWGGLYFSRECLKKIVSQGKNCPVRVEHGKSKRFKDKAVGKIRNWQYNDIVKGIVFDAEIKNKEIINKLKRGELIGVSISAMADTRWESDRKAVIDMDLQELSVTAAPACDVAYIAFSKTLLKQLDNNIYKGEERKKEGGNVMESEETSLGDDMLYEDEEPECECEKAEETDDILESVYTDFIKRCMADGKTMKECAAIWRERGEKYGKPAESAEKEEKYPYDKEYKKKETAKPTKKEIAEAMKVIHDALGLSPSDKDEKYEKYPEKDEKYKKYKVEESEDSKQTGGIETTDEEKPKAPEETPKAATPEASIEEEEKAAEEAPKAEEKPVEAPKAPVTIEPVKEDEIPADEPAVKAEPEVPVEIPAPTPTPIPAPVAAPETPAEPEKPVEEEKASEPASEPEAEEKAAEIPEGTTAADCLLEEARRNEPKRAIREEKD